MTRYKRTFTATITGIAYIEANSIEKANQCCKSNELFASIHNSSKVINVVWNSDTEKV